MPVHPCRSLALALMVAGIAGTSVLVDEAGAQGAIWQVDPRPVLRLPATAEDGRTNFGTAAWATRIGADEIALADGADRMVRIFGSDGRERRTFGRDGGGPGEFRSLGWIGTCGSDSLFAWDIVAGQMSVLHPRTGYARAWTNIEPGGPMKVDCSSEQEFAFPVRLRRGAHSRPVVNAATTAGVRYRIYLDTSDLLVVDATGKPLHAVDGGVRHESVSANLPNGRFASMERILGLETRIALAQGRTVLAYSDSGWVRSFDARGALRSAFRIEPPRERLTDADVEAAVVALLRRTPGAAIESFGPAARAVPLPDRAPAFTDLLSSPDGLLWFVRSLPSARDTRLDVRRVDGTPVATLTVPFALAIFEVGSDYLLGRVESEDGEQELVLMRYRPR